MDINILLCAVAVFAAVEASSSIEQVPRCLLFCLNGMIPGECRCNRWPTLSDDLDTPGDRTHPKVSSRCSFTRCGANSRCVERYGRTVCVPAFPTFPTFGFTRPTRRPVLVDDTCSLPMVIGRCRAAFRRYFYNPASGQCEQFLYGGCGGNANNFKTLGECRRVCQRSQQPIY
ncbi:BPTI/Kunitz domain-containing protein 2-like [Haliotis rufescens]|uniref:BPTI/Kunitz domain-containing protein 2-like n=1 Tax=Haliotis rufescens TaxID=6454 RepID=UPI00201F6C23|nr:BPTI/Kunitz domain-containing protein 2-like [Haliotis rufescens]